MKLLLDTHAFIWWLGGRPRLSHKARERIDDRRNSVFVSAVVAWEMATKVRLGKLPDPERIADDIERYIAACGFEQLGVTVTQARVAGALPGLHRDPFDRILIAQARLEDMAVVSIDPVFAAYAVLVVW